MNKNRAILSIGILLCTGWTLWGQLGQITGTVRDQLSNQPIPFVNIILAGTTQGTTSDSAGVFRLTNIQDDFVQLQLSSLGYEPLVSEMISVSKLHPTTVNFAMVPTDQQLGEVRVTANTFIKNPESPVSVMNIGIDLIEKSAGANRDISKVLTSFPGVGNANTFRNDLIVRGGGPSENRFYLDGMEIPTLNHFSTQGASGGPVGILNVDFIREVNLYSGAFPSAKGNALSSVFEFKQIDGNSDQTSIKGSVGASEVSLSLNTPLGEKSTLLLSARRSYLQFLFDRLGLPFLPTFNDFSFKTKIRFNPQNELTLLSVGALDQFKLNKSVKKTEENQYILSYIPSYHQWNYAAGAVYKHFFEHSYLTLVLSRNHLRNESQKYLNNIEEPENLNYDYSSNEIENKLRMEWNSRPYGFSLNVGGNLEYVNYDNYTYLKKYDKQSLTQIEYQTDLDVVKWGLFGSVSHPFFNNRLVLSAGLRMDANNYSNLMNQMLKQFSPRVSAIWQFTPNMSANLSAGKYYQLPAYTTMGYKTNQTFINRINHLTYIEARHYIAGLEWKPGTNMRISLEGFIKKYDHYPFSVSDSVSLASKGGSYGVFGDEEVTSTSFGEATGLELLIRHKSNNKLSYIISYTFVRSKFSDYKDDLVPSAWDSKHLITTTINKGLPNNWDIGIKWRLTGGLPYTPYDFEKSSLVQAWNANGREYLDYSKFNTQRSDAFHQLDLRIDKTYLFDKWSLGLYVDFQNLYGMTINDPPVLVQVKDNNGNPVILNPEAPEDQQRYQLKPLRSTSGTFLPSFGIVMEF